MTNETSMDTSVNSIPVHEENHPFSSIKLIDLDHPSISAFQFIFGTVWSSLFCSFTIEYSLETSLRVSHITPSRRKKKETENQKKLIRNSFQFMQIPLFYMWKAVGKIGMNVFRLTKVLWPNTFFVMSSWD